MLPKTLKQEVLAALSAANTSVFTLSHLKEKVHFVALNTKDIADLDEWYSYKIQLHEKIHSITGQRNNLIDAMGARIELLNRIDKASDCTNTHNERLISWIRSILSQFDLHDVISQNENWMMLEKEYIDDLFYLRSAFNLIRKIPGIQSCFSEMEKEQLEAWLNIYPNLLKTQRHS